MKTKQIVKRLFLIGLCIGLSADWAQGRPEDQVMERVRFDQNLDAALPLEVEFTNHDGETIAFGHLFGERPVIIVPMYFNCPMLCGLIVNGLLDSLREVAFDAGEDFHVAVISFDPRETASLAEANRQAFLERYDRPGTEAGIHFLVGEEPSIRAVMDTIGFHYEWVPEINDFAHASGIVLATPEGRLSRYFYGILYPPRDVRLGLVEASENRIGSAVDRLMLFCYQYDPATAQYGLLIHRVVNAAAASTATLLAAFVFIMLRMEKQRKIHPSSQPAEPS